MRRLILAVLFSAAACKGSDSGRAGDTTAATGGTLVVATATDADVLLPVYADNAQTRNVVEQIYDRLAEISPNLNAVGDKGFTPRLADRWDWAPDSLSIAFHLDPRARWQDGKRVTAKDVVFTHSLYVDPKVGSAAAPLLASIDSVTARDSATAVFWYARRTPRQFYDAVFQLIIMPEHLLGTADLATLRTHALSTAPVGNGRFRFVRWDKGSTIEIVADTTAYRGRAKLDRVIWTIAPDATTGVTKLMAGEADFYEFLRPDVIPEVEKNPNLKTVPYPGLQYGYMGFNLRDPKNRRRPHPLFADRELRRALTMATDRKKLVGSVFGATALPAIGPVPRVMSSADTTIPQIPYDVEGAKRILDSLGWKDTDGDGIREKGARKLEFGMLVPSSSRPRMSMSVLLQEAFRLVGAKVNLETLEFTTVGARLNVRDFETMLGVWQVDPSPGGIRQTWGIPGARARDGSNHGSYESPGFDAYVDSAVAQMDPAMEKAYFRKAYETIINDAPAIFLYEPKLTAGSHKRVRQTGMRPDAWWAGLADWWIPASERIDRDRIGLRAPATP